MPASICRRASRATAASSTAPVARERRHQRRAASGPCVRMHLLLSAVTTALEYETRQVQSPFDFRDHLRSRPDYNPSTSRIVNQPRVPCTHRAASSAPRAKTAAVARGVRQRDRLRRGVEADRVRAGNRPGPRRRHVDADGVAAPAHRRSIASAVPDGASRLAAWCSSWIQAPNAGCAAPAAPRRARPAPGTGSRRARSSAPRPRRCRAPPPRRAAAASSACQPVVPMTTFMPRAARRGKFVGTASASREVDRDVGLPATTPRSAALSMSTRAGDLEAVLGRQRLDQPAHSAVPDDQQRGASRRQAAAPRPPPRRARRTASCSRDHRLRQVASRSTTVMFRRDAACDTIRSGKPLERRQDADREPRIAAQAVADGAEHRHLVLDAHLGELPTAPRRAAPAGASSSTVTETLTSDVVTTSTGGPVALEHLEDPAQEAVRHQHPGRGDVDDRDVALAGERGERLVDRRLRGDERAAAVGPAAVEDARPGCLCATAGRIVLGCSTLAPK